MPMEGFALDTNIFSCLMARVYDGRDAVRFASTCRTFWAFFLRLAHTHHARILAAYHVIRVYNEAQLAHALRVSTTAEWHPVFTPIPPDVCERIGTVGDWQDTLRAESAYRIENLRVAHDTEDNIIFATDHYGSGGDARRRMQLASAAVQDEINLADMQQRRDAAPSPRAFDWRIVHFPFTQRGDYDLEGLGRFHRGTCIQLIFRSLASGCGEPVVKRAKKRGFNENDE